MPATRIGKLFIRPAFSDEAKAFEALKLWAAVIPSFVIFTVLLIFDAVMLPASAERAYTFLAVNTVMTALFLLIARSGHVSVASSLAILSYGAIFAAAAWTAGGVHSPAMMGFLIVVTMSGLLQGITGIVAATALTITASIGLLEAERAGFLPPPSVVHTSITIWITTVAAMLDLAGMQLLTAWVAEQRELKAQAVAAESEKIERARHETEAKFVTVFEASPDAIVITDLGTGEVIDANPSYAKLFGYTREEMIGRTTLELGIFGPNEDRTNLLNSIKDTGNVRDNEMMAYDRDGSEVPCLFSGQTVALGSRMCLVSVVHDLTRRKQAERREQLVRDEFTRKLFASQEMERRRIAGELHDSLGQNLILIKNRAQMGLATAVTAKSASEQFRELSAMASEAIAEVRQISHDLRPHQLDQLGLTRALESMFDDVTQNSLLVIDSKLDRVDDLFAADDASHLYRVAQESLNNVLKHSKAKTAKIRLERDLHDVRLWIEDDGEGFSTPGSNSGFATGGLGLSSISERVRILKGRLEINSLPGKGTRIDIVIPRSSET